MVAGGRPSRPADAVQSVNRAFDLLEAMADRGGDASLTELAAATDLPAPTIHRLVRSMVADGVIRQLPSRRYALGPRLVRLGETAAKMLGALAMPYLAALVDASGETANLATIDGDRAVYVAQAPSRHSMRMFTEVGRHVHLHCTGVGKALLAQLDAAAVTAVVGRVGLPARTPQTITDRDQLDAELRQIRDQGYAVDDGEEELGVRCVAVPVVGSPTLTAVSVSGPEGRLDDDVVRRLVPELQRAAAQLAQAFGSPT